MCSNALSIVASLFLLVISVSVNVFGVYEGDFCQLEDGSEGVCKKLTDCPSRIQEVMDGERDASSSGRCGFDESNEIVCCSFVTGQRLSPRPADAACQQYKNKVTNLGPKNINIKYYVFGGTPARSKDFPFTVALGYLDNNTLPIKYVCGGSLISSRHVLTAAHCVNNVNENVPVEVRLGNEDVTSNTSDVQRIGINDIIIHPQYKRTKFYNDVAILKLEKEIQLSTTVKPICLETNPLSSINTPVRANLIVLGWGVTTFAGDPSNRLMRTPSLSFVDKEECNKYYTGFKKLPNGVDDNLICAVDENKTRGSDACQGDSGGPLVISTGDGHRLIGVSAFGQGCGGSVPGVYTAIYSYLNWIEEHVW